MNGNRLDCGSKEMKIAELKKVLGGLESISFRLPEGKLVPQHFHVTEVGLVNKHFIDCGGVERHERVASFQLWTADDFDHRLAPEKFLKILEMSGKILGESDDLEIEVEYQQGTIGKFGLEFDGLGFALTAKQTACLAQNACGIPSLQIAKGESCCTPGSGCC